MDFALTEEERLFRQSVAAFAEAEIAPLAQEWDRSGEYPVALLRRLGDLGFLGIRLSAEYGGAGWSLLAQALLFEEMARASAGFTLGAYCHAVLAMTPIAMFGTEEQKRRYLVPGIVGLRIGAFGMTEPEAGSDLTAIRTRAVRDGDNYVVTGSKIFTTNAPIADFVVISAYTDPGRGSRGISLFIVDRDTPGFSVSRRLPMLGMKPAQTAEILLDGCRLPAAQRLGEEHEGLAQALRCLTEGRVVAAAFAVGLARAALEASLRYAKERVQFGRPIGEFQAIQFMLADMDTQLEAARLLAYRAAWLADRDLPFVKEASQAKLFASEACTRLTRQALHLHGAYGYMMDSPLQRYYRDTMVLEVGEGTSEIHRQIIARQLGF